MGVTGRAIAMVYPVPCPVDSLISIPSIEVDLMCPNTVPFPCIVLVNGHCVEHDSCPLI